LLELELALSVSRESGCPPLLPPPPPPFFSFLLEYITVELREAFYFEVKFIERAWDGTETLVKSFDYGVFFMKFLCKNDKGKEEEESKES